MSKTPMTIEIDGERFVCQPESVQQLDAIALSDTQFHVLENGKRHLIEVLEFDLHNRTCLLNVDGEVKRATLIRELDLQIERMGLNAIQETILKSLDAPMPGLVTQVHVQAGDSVEKGTPLVILEAMKMENVITAPHAATIKTVHVQKGQAMEKGGALIEFA